MTYTTIDAWARLTGRAISSREVEALIALDAVLLMPGTDDRYGDRSDDRGVR